MKNEIVLYQTDDLSVKLEVRVENENIWLTQTQIVDLFQSSKANISEHIKNIFQTGELNREATVRKFRTVQKEGRRTVERNLIYYNLDVIISVGYRVNTIRGTQFRIWANKVLKELLLRGYSLNRRMDRVEDNVQKLAEKVESIDLQIKADLPPNQGIFYDGQVFDAYVFVADLIKSAKKSILLIDNYIDESVLHLLTKRRKNVAVTILTKRVTKAVLLDVKKFNSQYPSVKIKNFTKSHDRFLIIDNKDVYHFGASLKDLGKKWFAFQKFDKAAFSLLQNIKKVI